VTKSKKITRIILLTVLLAGLIYLAGSCALLRLQFPNRTDFSPLAELTPEEVAGFRDVMLEFDQTRMDNYRNMMEYYQANSDNYLNMLEFSEIHRDNFLNTSLLTSTRDIRDTRGDGYGHEFTFTLARASTTEFTFGIAIEFFETPAMAEDFLMAEGRSFDSRWAESSRDRMQELIENDNDTSILPFRTRYNFTAFNHRSYYQVHSVVRIGDGVIWLRTQSDVRS